MQFWQKYVGDISYENQFEIVKDKQCKRIRKNINTSTVAQIQEFCEKNKISEFAFYLSIISIYFSKIFDTENIVIGTPFLNRQKSQKELDIMGMFVSTLPISINITNGLGFIDLCRQITTTNLACFKHSKFPYSQIQKEYANISGQNTNLYEIAFSYQISNLENSLDKKIYKTAWQPNKTQINPLVISYVNYFGENELCYDYFLKLFNEQDIDNIHDRLLVIINQVLENSKILVNNISILSDNDIALLQKFNNTGNITLTDETIVSRFERIVCENGNKIALIYKDLKITYTEFNKKINAIANNLIKLGIKQCSPISMIFDKSPEMFMTMLAIQKTGCYFIPILPEEEQERAEFIIKNSDSKLLITQKKYSTQISKNIISNQLIIDDLLNGNTNNPNLNINQDDLCYMIYTSGSTGTPKGVMITHKNLVSLMISMNHTEDLKYLENDISLSLLKYSFDGSAFDTFSTFLNGGTLVVISKEIELNPELVAQIIRQENITRFLAVPTWAERISNISKIKKIDLSSLRLINLGGEALKPQKIQYLYETYPNLTFYNLYGPTEATILTTMHKITSNDIENNYAPIGKPIPGSRLLVINKKNEILPINTKGELVIFQENDSLNNIGKGYYNLEEKTKANFINFVNPITNKIVLGYKTGDAVKINKNFEIDFLGRNDDFKKINGGYLVSLTEVETKIQKRIGNSFDIVVVAIPIRNINSIVLFVSKKSENINITISDIKEELENNLTFYMMPKQIIEIDNLPYNNNGKIDKKALEKYAIQNLNEKNKVLLPTNKIEQMIYDVIHDIIKSDFSITDDFENDLGIDSLNMAILYSKLNDNKISLQDLYNYPNVKDLAHLIKKELVSSDILENRDTKIINATNQMNLEKIMLTGATGFVGSHILKELAENETTKKIYCIVRPRLNSSSRERFENRIKTYFNEETCQKIFEKSVVIDGDLRKPNLGLDKNTFFRIFNNVKTIINSAANVKHIGKYNNSYIDNVQTVQNLINICLNFNISLAHVSTLSLNGLKNADVYKEFTENTLNINQTFAKNPYLISKFEAEQIILKNIAENYLNAKIFRIGNIMPRISDGLFQVNYDQNGFLLAINTLSNLKVITEQMLNSEICLTPIDECSKCIFLLLKSNYCNTIYHVENTETTKLSSIIDAFSKKNINFEIINQNAFDKKIKDNYSLGTEYISTFFKDNFNKYSNQLTNTILNELNFKWEKIQPDYLENIINISIKIKKGE